jgi:hypothetical protein
MLVEVVPTYYAIVVNGHTIASNLPSHQIAEARVSLLSESDRARAVIVPMTSQGMQVLFG